MSSKGDAIDLQIHENSTKKGNDNLIDTIAENADPKTLDFSVHQLFIDTTRTWSYYKSISQAREEQDFTFLTDEMVRNSQSKGACLPKSRFPNHFISLHQKEGTYFLYDRCDGGDAQFLVKDSLFIVFGTIEATAFRIENIQESTANKLTFQFTGYDGAEESVTIEKVTENRCRLTCSMDYLTTDLTLPNSVYDFDMIVNHCPIEKVWEYDFD